MKLLLFIICQIVSATSTLNVHDKMYTQLNAVTPCIVRLNGSQSFGCTSERNGNVGVIHIVYNDSDWKWVLDSERTDSYVIVLFLKNFTLNNLQKLNNSEQINGVLLIQEESNNCCKEFSFSPEDVCPNRYSGLAAPNINKEVCTDHEPWNPLTDFSYISMHKWRIPIFFSNDKDTIMQIEDCFRKFNLPLSTQLDRALCALKMSAHMFGSVDSTTCIRRSSARYNINPVRYCDPLGDENVYVPIIPFDKFKNLNRDYVIVAARLDSTSLFYGLASGSLSTATSLVALLLTANLLFNLTQNNNRRHFKKNVLFILFNGEAYDYIGSSRVVYDIENGQFPFKEKPINMDDISLFVELSQLRNDTFTTYHTYHSADKNVTRFINIFNKFSKMRNFSVNLNSIESERLPPSSFQNFIAKANISGFIFSSYSRVFKNKYYHSLFDNNANVNYKYLNETDIANDTLQAFIANFATVFAYSLFNEITEQDADVNVSEIISYRMADELLHCYIDTTDCKFFADTGFDVMSLLTSKLDYYVGVTLVRNRITTLTKLALMYLTGKYISASNRDDCASKSNMAYWLSGTSKCLESAVNVSDAVSPAFIIPEYDLSEGKYSSWTESSWLQTDIRMFLKPSSKYEWLVFIIGMFVISTSFVTLFWLKHNARELFNYPHLITASSL
ncbi:hypothetical protein PGB90_007387 [Kerria lacca]